MEEKKSHSVKTTNLPNSKPIAVVSNKPVVIVILLWILTLFLYFFFENKILSLPPMFYALIITLKKRDLIFTGHNSFFVIYDKDDKQKCDIYYHSEVKKWCYVNKLFSPYIIFLLNDGEQVVLKSSGSEVVSYLRKVLAKKEVEKKALKEAKEVIAKLKKGEDFAELAKEYYDDSSNSKSGGKLADFNHGQIVEAFEDAAKELKVGSYTTTPVKTEFGYHIILKTAQKDKPALKEVKDDIISDLTDEKLKDDSTLEVTALVELRKKHKVEIQDKDIKKLYEAYVEKNTK